MAGIRISIRVPAREQDLLVLLDAMVKLNRLQIRRRPNLPTLYESGVRYGEESFDPCTGLRKEEWRTIEEVLEHKTSDCEDLACYRVADLQERQRIAARPWLRRHGALWHVLVKLPDGRFEDPSRKLGMGARVNA